MWLCPESSRRAIRTGGPNGSDGPVQVVVGSNWQGCITLNGQNFMAVASIDTLSQFKLGK